MKYYWYRFPGMFHARTVCARDQREARKYIRGLFGMDRLPNGTEIWE